MLKDRERERITRPGFGTVTLSHAAGGATLGITVGSPGGPPAIIVGGLVGAVAGVAVPYLLSRYALRHDGRRENGGHAS